MTTPVVYVVGWGRSGSTLLDVVLGSLPGLTSTGELRYLWTRGLQEHRRCGCGAPVDQCAFWSAVLARVAERRAAAGRGALPAAAAVAETQQARARVRHTSRLLRDERDPLTDGLRALMADLYPAVLSVSGGDAVVDSSKSPGDAALLATTPGLAVHLVHLVRDPRAVAFSWQRRKLMTDLDVPRPIEPHGAVASSVQWAAWNHLAERVAGRSASYLRLRYEDFVRDPLPALTAIVRSAGLDVDPGTIVTDRVVRIARSHTVAGNPDRLKHGEVPLRIDDEWRTAQPRRQQVAATWPALPWLRRYGYPVAVGSSDGST